MAKSIFRVQKDKGNPYVILNKQFINNADLTMQAKGLLTFLLSLPDDWKIYEDEIVKHFKNGKASVRSTIKELISMGYIKRDRIRNSSGQLNGYNYYVYEIPTTSENPKMDKPKLDNQTLLSNNFTNNKETKNYMGAKICPLLTFAEYISLCSVDMDKVESIGYYLRLYQRHTGKSQPKHKKEKWDYIVDVWFNIYDSEMPSRGIDADAENMKAIIDSHFKTTYTKGNYSLIHFLSGNIKAHRYYENFGAF